MSQGAGGGEAGRAQGPLSELTPQGSGRESRHPEGCRGNGNPDSEQRVLFSRWPHPGLAPS